MKSGYLLLGTVFLASSAWANPVQPKLQSSQVQEAVSQPQANVIVRELTYTGSDSLAVGDPLGNSPVTPKHDAGPPPTRGLNFGPECEKAACVRAEKRWSSPTTWQQDRASGLSVGWDG